MPTYNMPATWVWDKPNNTVWASIEIPGMKSFVGTPCNTLDATWGSVSGSFTPVHFYKGTGQHEDSTGITSWGLDYAVDDNRKYEQFKNMLYWESKKFFGYSMSDIPVIPKAGTYKVKCIDYNRFTGPNRVGEVSNQWDMDKTVGFNVNKVTVAPPANIKQNQKNIYENILITLSRPDGNVFDYTVKEGSTVIQSGTNVTSNFFTIVSGKLKSTNATVTITSKFTFMGVTYSSVPVTQTLQLEDLKPASVDNFRIVGAENIIEDRLKFEWDVLNPTERATHTCVMEFWQDGEILYTNSSTSTSFELLAGALKKTSDLTVRYKMVTTFGSYRKESSVSNITVTNLISIKPIISDITLSSTNRDYGIMLNVTANNPIDTTRVYVGTKLVAVGPGAKASILPGSIPFGTQKIRVDCTKETSGGSTGDTFEKTFNMTQDTPLVYSLEPSNVPQNVNEVIDVSFAPNEFCDRWEITACGETYTGTTERSVKIAPNKFNKGNNSISITTYYTPPLVYELRTATRTSNFIGYGKPALPIHDPTTTYNTSKPRFTWENASTQESDVQAAFQIQILDSDGNILEDKTINSSWRTYSPMMVFENNKQYVVLLSIKNRFDLWSDFATKVITTSFNQLPAPTVNLFESGNNALVTWSGTVIADFDEVKVLRREGNSNWVEIGYGYKCIDNMVDYMIKPNTPTEYKVRIFDKTGAYSDSLPVSISVSVRNYVLTDVVNKAAEITLDWCEIKTDFNNNSVMKRFAGNAKPTIYTDKTFYESGQLDIKLENNDVDALINVIQNGKVFCLRNRRGKKLFVYLELKEQIYLNPFLQQLNISYCEVNFSEVGVYHRNALSDRRALL